MAQICVAKQSYSTLNILSDEFENMKILSKLPAWLVNKWIERVVDHKSMPDFDEFSVFIKEKATIAKHALWTGHPLANYSSSVKKTQCNKPDSCTQGQTHIMPARQVQDSQTGHRDCPVCDDRHKVAKCPVFGEMSLADRRSMIRDKNMWASH